MSRKRFVNGKIFRQAAGFVDGSFFVEDRKFLNVDSSCGNTECSADAQVIDLKGQLCIPGLVDIHTHGNSGCDFSDGSLEGLKTMAVWYARHGITSFLPTSMTLPYAVLAKAFDTAARMGKEPADGAARVMGINMEGPYVSFAGKGAQNAEYLKNPDIEEFRKLYEGCGGMIRLVDIAPELEGSIPFIEEVSGYCVVSEAHTDAGYEEAAAGFDHGSTHVTHLFNAMPELRHRAPGVIGAASERDDVYAELIADGLHNAPSAVRAAFRLFPGRICLISDSLRCTGMPDGTYEFGGQKIRLSDGAARLENGKLAGSVTNLFACMKKAISFGINRDEAIRAATWNPAVSIGIEDQVGSIRDGCFADFLLCDQQLNLKNVYIGGEEIQ